MTLTEIANRYYLDKGTLSVDECPWHAQFPEHHTLGYTDVYEKFMASKRNDAIKIMEIGVCDQRFPGGSLKMWHEYFPKADIWAIDNFCGGDEPVEFKSAMSSMSDGRVSVLIADQSSIPSMDEAFDIAGSDFEFIIEDGSHQPEHMMNSLACCFPHLKSGGVYFMEDLQTPEYEGSFGYNNLDITTLFESYIHNGLFRSKHLTEVQLDDLAASFWRVEMVNMSPCARLVAITKK